MKPRVVKNRQTPWIRIDASGSLLILVCERCGVTKETPAPVSTDDSTLYFRSCLAFLENHKDHKKGKTNAKRPD